MDHLGLRVFFLAAFVPYLGFCHITLMDFCFCSGDAKCSLLTGQIQDGLFVTSLTPIMDMRVPLKGLQMLPSTFCSVQGEHLTKRGFLLDTPILGLSVKPDCNGLTLDAHIGVPGVDEAHATLHGGTDGVDAGASVNVDGAKLAVHGGVDGNGKPQGGASAGVGIGKYVDAGVHVNAGANGTKVGAHAGASAPGGGPSVKGSVDYNVNNGKITASGTAGDGNGACVKGSKDITDPVKDFMNKAGKMGLQGAVQQHISQHGDYGTGFNPASFMQQAGMNNFMQNMGMGRK